MENRTDDTPPQASLNDNETKKRTHSLPPTPSPIARPNHLDALTPELPFGASTDAPLEDLPVPGDSHSKHSYYYDDATNYEVFNPDADDRINE